MGRPTISGRPKKALKNEDTSLAALYFQKAYESSLEKIFFLFSKDDHFSEMEGSGDQKHLVLVKNLRSSSEIVYKKFHDSNDPYEEISSHLDGEIKNTYVSFYGRYVLFVVSSAGKDDCDLILWEIKRDQLTKVLSHLSCLDRPAISRDGTIIFMRGNRIWYVEWDSSSQEVSKARLWVNKTPDKPFPRQQAKASFAFSPDRSPFMTYGMAGTYKLYKLADQSFRLLTREASHYKIFFIPRGINPGVIIGGASQQQLIFFNSNEPYRVIKKYNVSNLEDISFVKEDRYYLVQSNRVYLSKRGESTPLPFLARKVFAQKNGGAFFLSSIGTPMRYDEGSSTNRLSKSIFKRALDIEESK